MKNFLKGFALGFGLLAFFIAGVIVTKAYELYLQPKNSSFFSISGTGLNLQTAQQLAQQYSKELGKKCEIQDLNISYTNDLKIMHSGQNLETKENAQTTQNLETEQNQPVNIEQIQIAPQAKLSQHGYLRLRCDGVLKEEAK